MRLIADATVLIHLWRLRRQPGRLLPLRRHLTGNEAILPWMVFFEFARGQFVRGRSERDVRHFLADFTRLAITETQVVHAAQVAAGLQRNGETIGVCDVWIAAAALEENIPVLTANSDHFSRIDGMQVISYAILP